MPMKTSVGLLRTKLPFFLDILV